jgi:hypothetical protein
LSVKQRERIDELQELGVPVKFSGVTQVSVARGEEHIHPVTLWIGSRCGFFEVKSSEEYKPIYERIHHAIGLSYMAQRFYERGIDCPLAKSRNDIIDILVEYMVDVDAQGTSVLLLLDVLKEAKQWIMTELDQYASRHKETRPEHLVVFQNTPFYIWLQLGAPTRKVKDSTGRVISHEPIPPPHTHQALWNPTKRAIDEGRLLMQHQEKLVPVSKKRKAETEFDPSNHVGTGKRSFNASAHSSESPHDISTNPTKRTVNIILLTKAVGPSSQGTTVETQVPSHTSPFHGVYASPQYPNGPVYEGNNVQTRIVEQISSLICHAVASGRRSLADITQANAADMYYRDYSINERFVTRALILHFASQIRKSLPTSNEWVASPIYKSLSQTMRMSEHDRMAEAWHMNKDTPNVRNDIAAAKAAFPKFLRGDKKIVHRIQKSDTIVPHATGRGGGGISTRMDEEPSRDMYQSRASKSHAGDKGQSSAAAPLQDWQKHRDPHLISGKTPDPEDEEIESAEEFGRDGKRIPRRPADLLFS